MGTRGIRGPAASAQPGCGEAPCGEPRTSQRGGPPTRPVSRPPHRAGPGPLALRARFRCGPSARLGIRAATALLALLLAGCGGPSPLERVKTLEIVPSGDPLIVAPGATVQFVAFAYDADDERVDGVEVAWALEGRIGTLSDAGLLVATTEASSASPQHGTITATVGSVEGQLDITVTVAADTVTQLEVEATDWEDLQRIPVGQVIHFTAVGLDALGNRGTAGPRVAIDAKWTTDGTVGSITSTGLFAAFIPGQGEVTATFEHEGNPISETVPITVVSSVSGDPCAILPEPDYYPPGVSGLSAGASDRSEVFVGYSGSPDACIATVEAAGGTVLRVFHLIPALVARMPEAGARALERATGVRYALPNTPVHLAEEPGGAPRQSAAAQELTWNVDLLDADQTWGGQQGALHVADDRPAGQGIRVALVDTGVDADHPDLVVAAGTNLVSPSMSYDDDFGHGTSVAGICGARDNDIGMIGVAPHCTLLAAKVLDSNGNGTVSDVVAGIEWAVDQGAHIINLSLGLSFYHDGLAEACAAAWKGGQGALLVAAVGNTTQDSYPAWPGNFGAVIACAATGRTDEHSYFSVTGLPVELAAPGEEAPATAMGGGYRTVDGTSFSTAHVSGVAALVWSTGHFASAARVRQQLRSTAVDLGAEGRDTRFGYGRINALAATTNLQCADAG